MKAKPTERNHYLPQFYLRSFLTDEVFWVYYKDGSGPKAQTPINTGVEKNLYSYKNPDGTINDELERTLSDTENSVTETIKRLVKDRDRLKSDDISKLAIFFAFMATRVPNSINLAKELGEELIIAEAKKCSENIEQIKKLIDDVNSIEPGTLTLSPEVIQSAFAHPEDFEISLNKTLAMAMSIRQSSQIYTNLLDMNWCLCRAPSNIQFITSDSPLVPFMLNEDGTVSIGTGYGLPGVEVTIPLSPQLCIIMVRKFKQKHMAVNKKFVLNINQRTAWNGEIFIISSLKTSYAMRLASWASKSKDYPKVNKEAVRRDFL